MTSFLTSLYLLSFKQYEIEHSLDVDCVKTASKNVCSQGLYCDAKSEFSRSRCSDCKQQSKGKKSIKCMEKLYRSYKCIFSSWECNQPLLMFYSNGSIASIALNSANNTVMKIEIDDSLNGKFLPSRLVDAIVCQNHIFVTYSEPKLTHICINQESAPLSAKILGKKGGKVVGFDPKIIHIDLIGPASKNLERKLSLNCNKDHLLIWWKFTGDDVWPWTPVAYCTDRVNMLVYKLDGCLEILCTVKIKGELISAKYSKLHSNQILTVEEVKSEKDVCINVSVYEIIRDQCHHAFISKLPIQGKVLSFDWSASDKLIISDSNNQLLIYDIRKKSSLVTSLLFIPMQIVWHPQDCIALVSGSNGQIQCFDSALTSISFKMYYKTFVNYEILDLGSHFSQSFSIQKLLWQKSEFSNSCLFFLDSEIAAFLVLKFTLGSITKNNLSALELISQYLKCNAIDESILLLRTLNWWHASELHFQCLSKVANCLLRKPLNLQTQSGLELTLGTFYKNIEILPKRFVKLYEHKVNHIARRFFHHLLRYHQFRKAFLLAVDLESQDLFLDLSHVAKEKDQTILALVAVHKANELDSSRNSCSESSCSSSGTSEGSTASDYENDNWQEYRDSQIQLQHNSFLQSSSDQQYWLPIADKSKLTNNWLNSSEAANIYQPFPKEQSTCRLSSSPQYNYCKPPAQHHSTYSGPSTNSSQSDKIRVIPTSSARPLPDIPSNYSRRPDLFSNTSGSAFPPQQIITTRYSSGISQEKTSYSQENIGQCASKASDNEIEEIGDSKIKLVHFGII